MTTVLIILIVIFALGAVAALVRGVVVFIQTTDVELRSAGDGPSPSALKQNRMMWRRIQFQAAAVLAAVLLLMLAGGH